MADRLGAERQRTAGDAAAARFLPRMRRVEDRDLSAAPREVVCGPRAGRSSTDDGDIGGEASWSAARAHAAQALVAWPEALSLEPEAYVVIHYTPMVDVETGRFTVGVFQDVAWAEKGIAALKQAGFVPESLTVLAKESAEVGALLMRTFGAGRRSAGTVRDRRRARTRPARRGAPGRKPRSREAWAVWHDAPRRVSDP